MHSSDLYEKYLYEVQNGKSLSAIRKEMEALGYEQEKIKSVIRKIDDQIQQDAITKSNKNGGLEVIYSGIFAIALSAAICLVTYITIGRIYFIVFLLILWGLRRCQTGWKKIRNNSAG